MKKLTDEEKEFKGTLKKSRVTVSKTEPLKRMAKPAFELSDGANKIFKSTLKMLMSTEAVTALDIYSVTMLAFWIDILIETNIKADGKYVQTFDSGATNITGHFTVIKEANKNILSFLKVLGLTIKDRGTIAAFAEKEDEDEYDPLDEIIKGLNKKE